jgi:hypothetical protein
MEKRKEKIKKGIYELHGKKRLEEVDKKGIIQGSVKPRMFRCMLGRT